MQQGLDNNSLRIYGPRGRQSVPAVAAALMERKTSAAENALELLKFRHQRDRTGSNASTKIDESSSMPGQNTVDKNGHQQPQHRMTNSSNVSPVNPVGTSTLLHLSSISPQTTYGSTLSGIAKRPNLSRSPSAPVVTQRISNVISTTSSLPSMVHSAPSSNLIYPPELTRLLDGEHHTDDLATRFEVGWPLLEKWLADIGGGSGDENLGRVVIIYR